MNNIMTPEGKCPNVLHFHGQNREELSKTFNCILYEQEVRPYKSDNLAIVSCWTEPEKCSVLQQAEKCGYNVINIIPDDYDKSQQWYMPNKIKFFINVLENIDKEYILFVDGYDVLFTHLDDIISRFESQKYRILFNASCNNYPDVKIDKLYGRSKMGNYRYFNAGCCIGYREDLITFYKEALGYINIPNSMNSEQFVMRHAFAKYSLDKEQDFVGIDYKGNIFYSMGHRTVVRNDSVAKGLMTIGNADYEHKKTIIVTGSEGFIGKQLCNRLIGETNINLIRVDRKNGYDANTLPILIQENDVDVVYHLAAQTSVFNENLKQIEQDNISTFMDIALACEKYGTKLVYASSSTANEKNTTSMYGLSKKFNEEFASIYCPSATGVRLHNVWGENPREGTLYWHLLNDEEPTKLYNNGINTRSFTYIDDAIDGLIYASTSDKKLLNCVSKEKLTTLEFAKIAQEYNDNIRYEVTEEKRQFDNRLQEVDNKIQNIDLKYKKVRDVFNKMKRE